MENRTDGDGEHERRVKNVGDLDAKAEAEEEANGLWNAWKSCAWDLFLGAEAITPKRERERDFIFIVLFGKARERERESVLCCVLGVKFGQT